MAVWQTSLDIDTSGRGFRRLDREVDSVVRASGLQTGLVHLFLQHTSASLILCENADPDVRSDMETLFSRLAPDGDAEYRHTLEGPDDMAAHARTVVAGHDLTLPLSESRLALGIWQGIFLWEHRSSGHSRRIIVTVTGEPG